MTRLAMQIVCMLGLQGSPGGHADVKGPLRELPSRKLQWSIAVLPRANALSKVHSAVHYMTQRHQVC